MLNAKQIAELFDMIDDEIKATMVRLNISEPEARLIVGSLLQQERRKMRESNG